MSVREAAGKLGLSRVTVYRLIKVGELKAIELRGVRRNRFRIPESEVQRLLAGG